MWKPRSKASSLCPPKGALSLRTELGLGGLTAADRHRLARPTRNDAHSWFSRAHTLG